MKITLKPTMLLFHTSHSPTSRTKSSHCTLAFHRLTILISHTHALESL